MSKILEKNLKTRTPQYWKQFVGWVIDLKNKYWNDPFVRSEINVVVLQLTFALSLFIIASVFFDYLYRDVLQTVVSGIMEGIMTGRPESTDIGGSLELVRSSNFKLFSVIVFVLTVAFTFLISKITLRPVKNSFKSQKRFISDIAHELRTPLSVLKTNSEVSLMDEDLDSKIKSYIKSNIEELDRISEIINNLLSFNNLIRPEKMKFSAVDIGPIIDSSIKKLSSLAEKKQLEIITKKTAPHVVWGNSVALEQVITNLLRNAINYTNKNGSVTIRVSPDYVGNVVIFVEDTGIGIGKNDLLHIFEPFYRAESSRNRKKGTSSGLGLTIVSELVKMHSGRITIKSVVGKGTEAVVTLPYAEREAIESPDVLKSNEISVNFLSKKKEN